MANRLNPVTNEATHEAYTSFTKLQKNAHKTTLVAFTNTQKRDMWLSRGDFFITVWFTEIFCYLRESRTKYFIYQSFFSG